MEIIISLIIGAAVGGVGVAWRLKGSRTAWETAKAVIQGAGGTGPRQ